MVEGERDGAGEQRKRDLDRETLFCFLHSLIRKSPEDLCDQHYSLCLKRDSTEWYW